MKKTKEIEKKKMIIDEASMAYILSRERATLWRVILFKEDRRTGVFSINLILSGIYLYQFLDFNVLYIVLIVTGNPSPQIRWLKDSQVLNSTTSRVVESDHIRYIESTVTVKQLQRSDLHNQITCEGRNNNMRPPLMATVQVDMNCK